MKLQIIVGSVRENRLGGSIAEWYEMIAREHSDFEVELIDLEKQNLPMAMEPETPSSNRTVRHDYTKQWSEKISQADAFILITPEYNHAFSAPLKNALDHLYQEWHHKPVGLVSYGGAGGARSIESILPVLKALSMPVINADVRIHQWGGDVEDGKVISEKADKLAQSQLKQLHVYAEGLHSIREKLTK